MQIRDLEAKTGLERATIRYYEREGLLNPKRLENGYREYSQDYCQTLLKIKLLRQLGMPLERIRALQQGTEDFGIALSEQVKILERQIQSTNRAKEVCQEMRDAAVEYATLDVEYYMARLNRPAASGQSWVPKRVEEFDERKNQPRHPFRRLFARALDYALLYYLVQFFFVVVLRIRPIGNFIQLLLTYGTGFLLVPVEALMLSAWGTTPGKWVMGIRLEFCNGGKLPLDVALNREWDAFHYGMGWGIPFWQLWRMYQSYKEYQEEGESCWDSYTETTHQDYLKWRQILGTVGIILVCAALTGISVLDGLKPSYRGSDLTVAQFAKNYNFYMSLFHEGESFTPMNPDGSFDVYEYTIYVFGQPEKKGNPCTFETTDEGYVRTLIYDQTWTNVFSFPCIAGNSAVYAMAALAAQDGIWYWDLREFAALMDEQGVEPYGQITYQNIELSWTTEKENCQSNGAGCYYTIDDNQPSSLHVTFTIVINET